MSGCRHYFTYRQEGNTQEFRGFVQVDNETVPEYLKYLIEYNVRQARRIPMRIPLYITLGNCVPAQISQAFHLYDT